MAGLERKACLGKRAGQTWLSRYSVTAEDRCQELGMEFSTETRALQGDTVPTRGTGELEKPACS